MSSKPGNKSSFKLMNQEGQILQILQKIKLAGGRLNRVIIFKGRMLCCFTAHVRYS